ncbi:FG-GAP repeat domain-containing protein [Paenibacillus arenilitoris]|uniref:VCBS repeat-containing protein n=1 Tax=Paenibacillus arenilitoris TaxID=2772299 RepID=A0A927CNP7_9BACL|nr:VCBS repeat-containing protein [Paenibacillus arenilitoris]MBD2868930.1 VCBS repeat-containing protein [Paenibacillus arenilitoris]
MDEATMADGKRGSGRGPRPGIGLGAVLAFLLLATGCRYTAAPADLLQKPSISPGKQAIVTAVEKTLPAYSKLTLPLREEHTEAIRLVDVDGDGTEEAIVTYYNEYSTPEIMAFKYTASAWRSWVLLQQPLARQIAWLKFEDLDADGRPELIAGWIGGFDSPNVLEIYSFRSKPVRNEAGKLTLRPLESLPYSYAETGDLNDDGKPELAVISETGTSKEVSVPEFRLSLYNWKNGGLEPIAATEVFSDVNAYDRLIMGKVSPRHYGIILEASVGAHGTYTAMYAWEKGRLRLVYPSPGEGQGGISGKPTMSRDMNGDGILEMQWTREASGYPNVPYSDSIWINDWMQWDGREGFTKKTEEFSDYRYGVRLRIPEPWFGRYTLNKPKDEAYAIVEAEYMNRRTGAKAGLATLYAVPEKQWENVLASWKQSSRSYEQLLTDSGNVFAISFAKEAPAGWLAEDRQAFADMAAEGKRFASSLTIRSDFQ